MTALTVIGALVLSACRPAAGSETVVVGVGSSVEQQVLGAIAAEALRRADLAVELEAVEGQTVALRRRAGAGAIDVFWDYTGAAFALGLGEQVAPAADPSESYERIRTADERSGLHWLAPSSANATLALFVRPEDLPPPDADRSLTWLAGALSSGEATLCADPDFLSSPAGLSSLAVEYAINLDQVEQRPAGEEEAIEAVAAGDCFAGLATATSPAAAQEGLVPVTDVRSVFPAFVVAPVARVADPALRARIGQALEPVTAALDTATLAQLNAEVAGGADAEEVAQSFVDAALADEATPGGLTAPDG
jgi:osmoprotectant transport system substrate-binding protein